MKTTKSTLSVARMASRAARDSLPDHAKAQSPKKFTQPQLIACLVIQEFLQLDYRSTQLLLQEWSDLRRILALTQVPHFTTLCAAAKRLLGKPEADAILDAILDHCRHAKILRKRSKQAAIDSTGLEARHVSAYFTKRCQRHNAHYKSRYPKLSAICDTTNHLILGIVIDRGPKPDPPEAEPTLHEALNHQRFATLLGDAGYESEGFHKLLHLFSQSRALNGMLAEVLLLDIVVQWAQATVVASYGRPDKFQIVVTEEAPEGRLYRFTASGISGIHMTALKVVLELRRELPDIVQEAHHVFEGLCSKFCRTKRRSLGYTQEVASQRLPSSLVAWSTCIELSLAHRLDPLRGARWGFAAK